MKTLSKEQCQAWLEAKLGWSFAGKSLEGDYGPSLVYGIPVDTGAKTALARTIVRWIDTSEPGLFWITAWGVFPSSQNMALFGGYRKSIGEARPIGLVPGHVFADDDLREIECLVDLALYFYWDSILIGGKGDVIVKTSHDELVSVYAKDAAHLYKIQSDLDRLKLTAGG